MADVKLVTKFVDLGSTGGQFFALYGFRNIGGTYGSFGTLSETTNGSSNTTTSYLYSTSTDIKEIYWADQSTDTLYFTLDGNRSNSAYIWSKLKIGSTTFTRSTATSYNYDSGTDRTTWTWTTSTNPFGSTTNGTDVAIEILLTVNTGHTSSSTSKTITAGSTSDETYSFSNASSNQTYRLIKSSGTIASGGGTGTLIDSRTGGGNLIIDYSNNELPPAGNSATYQLQVSGAYVPATETESGFWVNTTGQSNSITITRESAAASYTVTAPDSINEGSSGNIQVETTNVANGTQLFYTLSPSGDFGTASGDFYIDAAGDGDFDVTPTADSTTEGAETATVSIRTGSTSGTVVATDTFTINDTSQGSSITPPSGVIVVTNSIVDSSNVQVLVSVTSNGSGGTLEFAQTTTNSVPATGWQSSSFFNQPNNSTRYYWASQDQDTSGAFASSATHTVANAVDLTIDAIESFYLNNSAANFNITIANGDSDTTYRVRSNNSSGAIEGSTTGNGSLTVSDAPADNTNKTYSLTGQGGTNTGHSETEIQTFEVTTVPAQYSSVTLNGNTSTELEGSTEVVASPLLGTTVSRVSGTAEFAVGTSTTPGTYNTSNKTIYPGDYLWMKDTTSANTGESKVTTFSINGVQRTFTVSTGTVISDYGLAVLGPNGTSIVFSPNHKTFTYVEAGTVTLQASGTTGDSVDFTGIDNATDETKIAVDTGPTGAGYDPNASLFEVIRSTANGGTITLKNKYTGNSITRRYRIVRLG